MYTYFRTHTIHNIFTHTCHSALVSPAQVTLVALSAGTLTSTARRLAVLPGGWGAGEKGGGGGGDGGKVQGRASEP